MAANQPSWPREWLMTDERFGDRLWEALDRLPRGRGGIVFRHYTLSGDERVKLGKSIATVADRRGLVLAVAGSVQLAERLGAALCHNPDAPTGLPISLSVHDENEAARANEIGPDLAFVSPVYGTRSHPGTASLGTGRAAALAELLRCSVIALGGMNPGRFGKLDATHPGLFHGFAGIDCWLGAEVRT
jgi:thiamine-phosphate pyrophosphorylase